MSRIRLEPGSEPFPGLKLVQILGRGGFADVWEGVNAQGDRIAVKFMAHRHSTTSVREMRIIQAIQKISHRNLLRIEQVIAIPDYIVIAMELADGSLFDLLELYRNEYNSALSAELTIGYLRQIASALDCINARRHMFEGRQVGFQHCDVKPSNILLVGAVAKLADFGLSTPTVALQSKYERAGTLDFAAAEVHRGSLTDSSDQYSLAITYYYLRTATFPFPAVAQGFQRQYSYNRPAPDLNAVSRGEQRALERALDLEPTNRWPTCTALMTHLSEAVKCSTPDPLDKDRDKRLSRV